MTRKTFEECGSCGMFHRRGFCGDCRDNIHRYHYEEIPKGSVIYYLTETDEEVSVEIKPFHAEINHQEYCAVADFHDFNSLFVKEA